MQLSNSERRRSVEGTDTVISRADWRFLLPDPNPGKTLCFVEGTLVETAQLFSATTLSSEFKSGAEGYDLAVLKNPDYDELRYAWSVLKPGASCYVEWDVNVFFSPGSIRKKLEAAGFESVDQYMPKPDPDMSPPGIWIPLESYGAVNYILNSFYKSQPASRHAGKKVLYALWSLYPGVFIKFPWLISSGEARFKVCSIARKPDAEDREADRNMFKSRLMKIGRLLPDSNLSDQSAELSTMIISGGLNRLNKVVLVVFSGSSTEPSYIVKIPRTINSESALRNEAATLHALNDNNNSTKGIPRVLYDDDRLGFFSVGETYMDGRILGEVLDRNNLPVFANKLTHWLIDLAKKTATRPPEDWGKTHISPLIEELRRVIPNSPDKKLVNKTIDTISSLEIPTSICEHRDFAPWNILVAPDEQLGILDWESSRLDGIPGLDLIYFLVYLCLYVEDAWTTEKALECYKKMLDEGAYPGNLYHDCLSLYANELGLSPRSIKPLRIITWLSHLASMSSPAPHENLLYGIVSRDAGSLFQSLLEYEISSL